MSVENYVNLFFDEEKIRLTVLTNICRMLTTRGYMSIDKYGQKKNEKDTSIVEKPSTNDHINNSLFLPFIGKRSDNGTYTIPLDTVYRDQREDGKGVVSGASANFDGKSVVVKLIPQVVKDTNNSPIVNDFLKTYANNHKIIVFDGMADKVYITLSRKKNTEVFERDFFMIDLMSHYCAPVSCSVVSDAEMGYIINPKVSKIHENDPLVRYYNGKRGQVMHILRTSLNNSVEPAFRKIIEPKPLFR
jgi:hypothetical protein